MKKLLNQFLRRQDHVVWKVIEGKGILLNLENGSYFEVDPVGLTIWQRCDGKRTFSDIAQIVAEEFETGLDRVSLDLKEFVGELKRRRLAELLDKPEAVSIKA